MIKKLKIGLLIAVLSLAVGVGSASAVDDLGFANNTNITLGVGTFVVQAGSTATSMTVSATQLSVTVPESSTFILVSPNRYLLTNDLSLTQNCNNSQNSVTVFGATGGTTAVFTPVATVCTAPSGGGGLNTGGTTTTTPSGGTTSTVAQSTTPVTITVSPTVTMTTTTPGCSGGNKYNTSTGALCVNNVTTTGNVSTVTTATGGTYNLGTVTLKNGSKGAAAKELQRFLNDTMKLGLALDGKIGPKTIAVIKKWQKDNGLVADGLIGAKTKAKMNAQAQ